MLPEHYIALLVIGAVLHTALLSLAVAFGMRLCQRMEANPRIGRRWIAIGVVLAFAAILVLAIEPY